MSESQSPQPIIPPTISKPTGQWRLLAARASREQDPQKFLALVSELCAVLEEREVAQTNPYLALKENKSLEPWLLSMIVATKADFGNVQLLDTANGTLKIIAAYGFDSEFLRFFGQVSPSEGCACSAAMKNGSRIVVADVERDPLFSTDSKDMLRQSRVHSLQSTPLLTPAGRLIGVVSTHYMELNGPRDEMWETVDCLAADFVKQLSLGDGQAMSFR